jgi:cytosine deaminase
MADDTYYMKQALMEAVKAAEQGEVPVGAVVVCRDRIIGRGHNLTETLNDVTAHAEMQAVTAAANTLGGKYLNECTFVCHSGTVCDVCRCYSLGTDRKTCLWC